MDLPRKMRFRWTVLAAGLLLLAGTVGWRLLPPHKRVASPEELIRMALGAPEESARIEAAAQLVLHPDRTVENLRQVFKQGGSEEVRSVAALGLGQARDWESMPDLIAALEDPSEEMRARAALAIKAVTGQDFGFRANGPEPQRRTAIVVIRQTWPVLHEGDRIKQELIAAGKKPVPKRKYIQGVGWIDGAP